MDVNHLVIGRGTGKSFLLDLMLRYLREKHPPKGYVANLPEVPLQGAREDPEGGSFSESDFSQGYTIGSCFFWREGRRN